MSRNPITIATPNNNQPPTLSSRGPLGPRRRAVSGATFTELAVAEGTVDVAVIAPWPTSFGGTSHEMCIVSVGSRKVA
jgi:hypothetical protein